MGEAVLSPSVVISFVEKIPTIHFATVINVEQCTKINTLGKHKEISMRGGNSSTYSTFKMFGNFFSINVCLEKYRNKNPWKMGMFKNVFELICICVISLY